VGLRAWVFGFRVCGFGSRVSGVGIGVPDLVCRDGVSLLGGRQGCRDLSCRARERERGERERRVRDNRLRAIRAFASVPCSSCVVEGPELRDPARSRAWL
jgi:hypothetical protein